MNNIWFTCCTHLTSYAVWVDEITAVTISINRVDKNQNILKKFYVIFNFLSLCAIISVQNIGRVILLIETKLSKSLWKQKYFMLPLPFLPLFRKFCRNNTTLAIASSAKIARSRLLPRLPSLQLQLRRWR